MSFTVYRLGSLVEYKITDGLGVVHRYTLNTVDPAFNANTRGALIETKLARILKEQEIKHWVDQDSAPINPQYATAAQWRDGIREAYRNASKLDACRIAYKIRNHINNGDITVTQIRAAFGMTLAQWNAFYAAKIVPQADAYVAFLAAVGE